MNIAGTHVFSANYLARMLVIFFLGFAILAGLLYWRSEVKLSESYADLNNRPIRVYQQPASEKARQLQQLLQESEKKDAEDQTQDSEESSSQIEQ